MDSIYDNARGLGSAAAFDLGTMGFMQEPYAPLRGRGAPDLMPIMLRKRAADRCMQGGSENGKVGQGRKSQVTETRASERAGFQWKKFS